MECVARDLLLLSVITDVTLAPQDRVEYFLEIYGNYMIRSEVEEYVDRLTGELIDLVTEDKGRLSELVVMDKLKLKQRDQLELIFKSWRTSNTSVKMEEARDNRLRSLHKDRYDVRDNLADWDYNMRIQPHASIIHDKW
eukprot:TRINITY_DN1388_c0_g1_i1.p1 TRINITY_DN1388_c0_g1~~TRINITY_DN1388_c0_g1_i1.p1  ORF type:complete len:139 (+),score=39.84 TRINITY_DN1388_c0_g1_i1:78-494(+)